MDPSNYVATMVIVMLLVIVIIIHVQCDGDYYMQNYVFAECI